MHDELWQETVAIAEDYLSLCCSSQRRPPRAPDCVAVTMRDMIEHVDQESQDLTSFLDQLLGQLGQTDLDPVFVFRLVIAETSRPITWFRVINIFWTAGAFAKHMRVKRSHQDRREEEAEEEQSRDNRRLAEAIADFLAVENRDWMLEQNGWVSVRPGQTAARC